MAEKPETKTSPEAKFEVSELRRHCKELFGVKPEVFDGAFFGVTGKYSKSEAETKIKNFLRKKVKKGVK